MCHASPSPQFEMDRCNRTRFIRKQVFLSVTDLSGSTRFFCRQYQIYQDLFASSTIFMRNFFRSSTRCIRKQVLFLTRSKYFSIRKQVFFFQQHAKRKNRSLGIWAQKPEFGGWRSGIFGVMMRRAPGKSETTFVKKNSELVSQCGFEF